MFYREFVAYVAKSIGTTEPGVTLVFSVMFAYPLAIIYQIIVRKKSPYLQHIFFLLCGLGIGFITFGTDVIHGVISVFILNMILLLIGGTCLSVCITIVFFMVYLTAIYYLTATDDYDFNWVIPQCILTLRLIALSYDMYDGKIDKDKLSARQRETALKNKPTLLEIAGCSFFFGGFFVGPQFSMRRYQDFVNGRLLKDSSPWISVIPGLKRGFVGSCYVMVFVAGSYFVVDDDYLLSSEFDNLYLWKKFAVLLVWSKISLSKYVGIWSIAEGSCILSGLAYNGKDECGRELWDACTVIKIRKYESAMSFGEIVASFNVNTNQWVAEYIYKRLKFLNNKWISQVVTLAFLALWHGIHSGYYLFFFMEIFLIYVDKGIASLIYENPNFSKYVKKRLVKLTSMVILKVCVSCLTGYFLIPFVLLPFHKWFKVYKSLYFVGHIIYFSCPFIFPLLRMILSLRKKQNVDDKNK